MSKIHSLLQQAINQTHAWAAAINVPNDKGDYLIIKAQANMPKDWDIIRNALNNSTANGRCYINGKNEILQDKVIDQPEGATSRHEISALAAIPIRKNEKVVGVLEVLKDEAGARFTDEEVAALESTADNLEKFIK